MPTPESKPPEEAVLDQAAEAIEDAREELAEAREDAMEAAESAAERAEVATRFDALESRLGALEDSMDSRITAGIQPVLDRLDAMQAEATEVVSDVADEVPSPEEIEDATEVPALAEAEPVVAAESATSVIDEAPRRDHPLFRNLFGKGGE